MDVLREREVKDSLERQLTEEQKLRSKCSRIFNLFCHVHVSETRAESIPKQKSRALKTIENL